MTALYPFPISLEPVNSICAQVKQSLYSRPAAPQRQGLRINDKQFHKSFDLSNCQETPTTPEQEFYWCGATVPELIEDLSMSSVDAKSNLVQLYYIS